MAIHTELPIYRTGVQLLTLAVKVQEQMPRGVKRSLGDMTTPHPDIYTEHEAAMDALDAERISHGLTRGILMCARQPEPAGEAVGVPEAVSIVTSAMREDLDYAWAWHCNIAMASVDEGMEHYAANKAAARFLSNLANVDTTQHAGFPNPPAAAAAPAVPQGLQPIETIKYWADAYSDRASGPHFQGHGMVVQLLREYAQLREALAATPTTAPAQDPSEMTLRDYAEAFIEAGHDFWKACRRDAGGGAVRWLSCDDGTLIVFTRGEYREAIMGAVGGYRATEVVFEDQGSDEQNGMVACAAPAQEVGLTDAHPMQPIVIADDGVIRFKRNKMVDDMYEFSAKRGFGLNEMAMRDYSQEDRNQFAQLIGYSVSGWGGLSYAMNVDEADAIAALRAKGRV